MNLLVTVFAATAVQASDPQPSDHRCPEQPPPQSDIDHAVASGVAYLQKEMRESDLTMEDRKHARTLDELILAGLVYGGLPEDHADVQWLLQRVLERPIRGTYEAVLLMVALDKLDRCFFLWKLIECAQFLLDSQCANGQWHYWAAVEPPESTRRLIQDARRWGEANRKRKKPETQLQVRPPELTAGRPLSRKGDNSNTQFASLGLKIAADAGIRLPKGSLERAREWWLGSQRKEGSWSYSSDAEDTPRLSMTAGGLSSLAAIQDVLNRVRDSRSKDPRATAVRSSIDQAKRFIAANFSFAPRDGSMKEPYTHFALERAGILASIDRFGPHPWYAEGADHLVKRQLSSGAWSFTRGANDASEEAREWRLIETGLAILFFRRSVRPPVITKDNKNP